MQAVRFAERTSTMLPRNASFAVCNEGVHRVERVSRNRAPRAAKFSSRRAAKAPRRHAEQQGQIVRRTFRWDSHRREHRTKRRGSPSARVRVCAREEQPAEEPRGRSIPSAVGRAAEGSAGLQVEHQLVLRRRLHRKVGWLLASKDAVNVFRSSPNYHQDGSSPGRAGRAILDCMPGVQSSQGQTAVRSGRSLYIGRSIAGDGERNSILAESLASVLSGEGGTT